MMYEALSVFVRFFSSIANFLVFDKISNPVSCPIFKLINSS